jgi:hypothetical protein
VADAAAGGPDFVAADAAQSAASDRLYSLADAVKEIRAQSVRGFTSKARVADLIFRNNGKAHSTGRHDAWMVVDDLLAMGGVQS